MGTLNFLTAWQLIFPQSTHPRESKLEATCLSSPTLINHTLSFSQHITDHMVYHDALLEKARQEYEYQGYGSRGPSRRVGKAREE